MSTWRERAAWAAATMGLILLVGAAVLIVTGCGPALAGVKTGQRIENAAGHTTAGYLYATCDYDKAQTEEDIERLDDLGCIGAAHLLTEVSSADQDIVTLVDAYEAGQCVATIARDVDPKCDLLAAGKRLKAAAERLKAKADQVRKAAAK